MGLQFSRFESHHSRKPPRFRSSILRKSLFKTTNYCCKAKQKPPIRQITFINGWCLIWCRRRVTLCMSNVIPVLSLFLSTHIDNNTHTGVALHHRKMILYHDSDTKASGSGWADSRQKTAYSGMERIPFSNPKFLEEIRMAYWGLYFWI